MRPKTATIQVSQVRAEDLWVVEIGDPKKSTSTIKEVGQDLGLTLIKAILFWQKVEGLGD